MKTYWITMLILVCLCGVVHFTVLKPHMVYTDRPGNMLEFLTLEPNDHPNDIWIRSHERSY